MNRAARWGVVCVVFVAGIIAMMGTSAEKTKTPHQIDGYGKVTRFPEAPEQPRDGSKIVVDLTAGGPPDQLNKGLEKVARFVNIYSQAGKLPAHAKICVVLHDEATGLSLNDSAYAAAFRTPTNPNRPLLKQLHHAGVEFLVCGQALTSKGYPTDQAMDEVPVAVSGLTALVNRQQQGYAYVPLSK